MGTVWKAEQSEPVKRTVALKIIKAGTDTKEVIARFEAERQALAMMHHPNIAQVLNAGATCSPARHRWTRRSCKKRDSRNCNIIREDDPPTPSTRISSLDVNPSQVARHRATASRNLIRLLRGDLDVIVMKAIEKERGRRYTTPIELADDIRRHLHSEPIAARPPSRTYRLKRLYQRHKVEFIAASLIATLMLAGTVASSIFAFRATKAEGLAEQRLREVTQEQERTRVALSESEAVMQMLANVFQSPDPTRDGQSITVVEVLDRETERIETELANHSDRQAILREVFADTYESLSMYVKTLVLRQQVYEHWRKTRGRKTRGRKTRGRKTRGRKTQRPSTRSTHLRRFMSIDVNVTRRLQSARN